MEQDNWTCRRPIKEPWQAILFYIVGIVFLGYPIVVLASKMFGVQGASDTEISTYAIVGCTDFE